MVKSLSVPPHALARFPLRSHVPKAVNSTSAGAEQVFSTTLVIMTAQSSQLSETYFQELALVTRNTFLTIGLLQDLIRFHP